MGKASRMSISEFKAHALGVLDEVSKTKGTVVITKRGKAIAQVLPFDEKRRGPRSGRLKGTIVFQDDIITPLGSEMWSVGK